MILPYTFTITLMLSLCKYLYNLFKKIGKRYKWAKKVTTFFENLFYYHCLKDFKNIENLRKVIVRFFVICFFIFLLATPVLFHPDMLVNSYLMYEIGFYFLVVCFFLISQDELIKRIKFVFDKSPQYFAIIATVIMMGYVLLNGESKNGIQDLYEQLLQVGIVIIVSITIFSLLSFLFGRFLVLRYKSFLKTCIKKTPYNPLEVALSKVSDFSLFLTIVHLILVKIYLS